VSDLKRWIIIAATAVVAVSVYFLLPETIGSGENATPVPELARRSIAIFVVAVIFWATEVIPLFATSLLVIGMQVVFLAHKGGMAGTLPGHSLIGEDEQLSYSVFLDSFSSGVIILFMGGFLLSAAVSKHGLDRAIAAKVLRPFSKNPYTLIMSVIFITGFFSMWMSNTATSVMMLAIIMPLVRALPEDDAFHRAVILAVPMGANIGGIGTPIGTPPNAIALAQLREYGFEVGFVDWMMMAVPLAILLCIVAGFMLMVFFKPAPGLVLPRIETPTEPISWKGRLTLMIMVIAIVLWVTGGFTGLSSAAVALLAAAALTTLGVLRKRDVDSIDWNVLILMWGGLSLGTALEVTGAVGLVQALPIASLSGTWLAIALAVIAVSMSTFMSNTAATTVLVPIAIAMAAPTDAAEIAILVALSASFAMAMPVSTPPNAVAFGTGKVPAIQMIRVGTVTSLICMVVLLAGYRIILPMMEVGSVASP
jgi:sodium-dependent dicarboxylate transporter 2/3/5